MMPNRKLIRNISYMYILQGCNYLLPLIAIPYMIRILGLKSFGLLSFVYAFVNYFVVIVNYGCQLTGTRLICESQDEKVMLSRLFCSIVALKLILMTMAIAMMSVIVFVVPELRNESRLVAAAAGAALFGNAIFPNWYYMGREYMRELTIVHMTAKLIYVAGLFVFVSHANDIRRAAFLQSSVEVTAGAIALIHLLSRREIKLTAPSIYEIRRLFAEGWHVFKSQIYVTMLTSSNVFILGFFAAPASVGMYATAEKVVRAVIGLIAPLNQAIYPFVNRAIHHSRETTLRFLGRLLFSGSALLTGLGAAIAITAEAIVTVITGERNSEIAVLIRVMCLAPLAVHIYNLYGNQLLLTTSMKEEFASAICYAGVISIALSMLFVPIYKEFATAVIFVISELIIMILMIQAAHRRGLVLSCRFL